MASDPVHQKIADTIASSDVVLFMKGTKQFPQCGFSATAAKILEHLGVPFKDVNVLEDQEVREGIKAFSNWPTIPQLYVKGEFVGGCDIMREMYSAGELHDLICQKGIPHAHHHDHA
jgi:monothiol glutaredoxin